MLSARTCLQDDMKLHAAYVTEHEIFFPASAQREHALQNGPSKDNIFDTVRMLGHERTQEHAQVVIEVAVHF